MIEAAQSNDVFLMEAFMYRCHPQMQQLAALIQQGAIGAVRLVRASFGYHADFDPHIRAYNRDLAAGGILDVGGYTASAARFVAGAAAGTTFLDPQEVKACGVIGASGVDYYTAATLRFANGSSFQKWPVGDFISLRAERQRAITEVSAMLEEWAQDLQQADPLGGER